MVERRRQQLHVQIGLLFTTCDYCVLTFYNIFNRNHLDPLFRTVSRVPGGHPEAPRVPRGPFPEDSRKFEEVGEGSRRFEEVGEGRESQRKFEKVREVRARERERERKSLEAVERDPTVQIGHPYAHGNHPSADEGEHIAGGAASLPDTTGRRATLRS